MLKSEPCIEVPSSRKVLQGVGKAKWGDVAQLGERRLCKPEVAGSIPVVSMQVVGS